MKEETWLGMKATTRIMFIPWRHDEYFSCGERWFVFGLVVLIVLMNGIPIMLILT